MTYTITVTRAPSSDATLANLAVSIGTLNPAFATGTTNYTVSVANTITSVKVTPTTTDATAVVTINGAAVVSGKSSASLPLAVGPNTVTTIVTAQDGSTTKTYTITITRALPAIANLSALQLSTGVLSPAFAVNRTSYSASVVTGVSSTTVTPTATDPAATITVNGAIVASGGVSASLPLAIGPNTINTVVTAQDGITTKTYTVTVTRAASANANILKIKLSSGTLSPAFVQGTTSYTAPVTNAVASITVTPTLSDATATVKVNGTLVASGTASGAIALNVGSNIITTIATARDGKTTKNYTITVTRAMAGANSFYEPVGVTRAAENPQFTADGINVHQGVSPNGDGINDFLVIDGIAAYPDNKLVIMSRNGEPVFEVSGYDNNSKVFDGHSNKNGRMQQPGTYFYALDYKVAGISKHKTGFIILKY
jgi:gliding motility-associated-like protein